MKHILFDCDNTMGLEKKDVDDGLVLLYLLGREDVRIEGITSVFGNGTSREAYQVTEEMIAEMNLEIPLYFGAEDAADIETPAANFLVKKAKDFSKSLTLLATGPVTNLKAAYQQDPDFFSYFEEIILMGGLTEPLYFGDQEIEELNFSCDPEAAKLVLEAPVPVMLASGNLCLEAFFNQADWNKTKNKYEYIADYIKHWYYYGKELIGKEGFYMWDLVSALYITNPELYNSQYYKLKSQVKDLKTGDLILEKVKGSKEEKAGVINIPTEIKDVGKFKDIIFTAWANL